MYDEVFKGYEEERERLYEKMREIEFDDEKYEIYFTRVKELQKLISEQRQVEREDKKTEIEAFRLREEELSKGKIHFNFDLGKILEVSVFAAVSILALVVEVNGDVLKFDTTKGLLRLNRL